LRDGNFRRRVWRPALAAAGLSRTHFHDLRHTGNTLTATVGASLRELMDRMGHSSPRAALIYLHGSDARQRAIADGLNRLVEGELRGRVQGIRRRHGAAIGHVAGTCKAAGSVTGRLELGRMRVDLGFVVVGRTGFEPVTSSVSGRIIRILTLFTETTLRC
jgi:hypothetical protein